MKAPLMRFPQHTRESCLETDSDRELEDLREDNTRLRKSLWAWIDQALGHDERAEAAEDLAELKSLERDEAKDELAAYRAALHRVQA